MQFYNHKILLVLLQFRNIMLILIINIETMEITKDNFEAETSKDMILLDFWAEWCGPCQGMMPVLAELEKSGTKVGKINVDEQQDLAAQFRVMSIPTFVLFKDGKAVEQIIGSQSLEVLQAIVKNHS